ncbi:MAG: hypothetical protein QG591_1770 [Planctomycetota bacterium]|nr:hypothetical protein [Planctomycetota bacterium]
MSHYTVLLMPKAKKDLDGFFGMATRPFRDIVNVFILQHHIGVNINHRLHGF